MARPRTALRTSQEAYNRIRWDERLARRPFVIVVEDRPAGTKQIPLGAFTPDGDIPWHRVRQVLLDGSPVWCREQRLDRLDEIADLSPSLAPPSAVSLPAADTGLREGRTPLTPGPLTPSLSSPSSSPLPRPGEGPGVRPLRVATYNVLYDAYDADLIDSERRRPAIVRELGALGADLIGLSEVTPELLALLLDTPWVTARYQLSDDASGASVRPHGQLLLSRWPITSSSYLSLTPTRRVLCCDVEGPTGPLRVLVLHLASNATRDATRVRREELTRALATLPADREAVVMGDFNLDEDELADLLRESGARDPWRTLLPEDPGYTYAPAQNSLAALFSRDGRSKRYDRVLLLGKSLEPCGARLFATDPLPGGDRGLFPSDHFGVLIDLRPTGAASLADAPATYHSALVLLPAGGWEAIEALRAEHDRGFLRWMPHVTLLYGFAPTPLFPEALERVARACRAIDPFRVRLESTGRFDHNGSVTLWLDPGTDGSLPRLQAALQREFPRYNEQSEGGFTPHLTIGRFPKQHRAQLEALERELRRSWKHASFDATEIHLLARRDDLPFESIARVELGSGRVLAGVGTRGERDPWAASLRATTLAETHQREEARALVSSLASAAAEARSLPAPWVDLFGSSRLCPEDPYNDLDLLLLCPPGLGASEALSAVHEGLTARGALSRLALDAWQPSVRAVVRGVEVDVLAVELPEGAPPMPSEALLTSDLASMSEQARTAVLGVHDAFTLGAALGPHRARWSTLLRTVKRWLRARGLKAQWAGYPGGLSWSVLTARCCLDHPGLEGPALLERFFAWCAAWPWPQPVALTPSPGSGRGPMPVMAPALPWRETTRTVSPATLRVLLAELHRAAELVASVRRHKQAAGELFAPAAPSGPVHRVVATGSDDERREQRGQLERGLLGVLRQLEAQGHAVRPFATWERTADGDTLAIGLTPTSERRRA